MYVTGWNEMYALDATTGRQLWSYSEPHTAGLLGDASGGPNRGPAISGERVIMTTDHAHLIAFNRFSGQKLWEVELGQYKEGYTGTAAPLVVGDLVIHGVSGGDEGIRGFIDAYRIATGERVEPDSPQSVGRAQIPLREVRVVVPQEPAMPGWVICRKQDEEQTRQQKHQTPCAHCSFLEMMCVRRSGINLGVRSRQNSSPDSQEDFHRQLIEALIPETLCRDAGPIEVVPEQRIAARGRVAMH
jgi:PQQ-like domain